MKQDNMSLMDQAKALLRKQRQEQQRANRKTVNVEGINVHYPKGYYLTQHRVQHFLEQAAWMARTFKRPVSDIFVNDDWSTEGNTPHDVCFKFKRSRA